MTDATEKRLKLGIAVIGVGVLLAFLGNDLLSRIDLQAERWVQPYMFPLVLPVGDDFREGLFYPAKILLQGKSPYIDYNSDYPPLSILLATPFRLFKVNTAYLIQVVLLYGLNILAVWVAMKIATLALDKDQRQGLVPLGGVGFPLFLLVTFLMLSSYGFMFSIERGNCDIYAVAAAMLGIWLMLEKPDRVWLHASAFSVAANIKLYPSILFFLILWRHGRKGILPLATINTVLLLITGPANAVQFIQVITRVARHPFLWVGNHSAASFGQLVNGYLVGRTGFELPTIVFYGLPTVVWLIGMYLLWKQGFSPAGAAWMYALAVPMMCVIPSTSHDYKLVLLGAPAAMVLLFLLNDYVVSGQRVKLLQVAAVVLLMLFLSLSYTMLPLVLGNKYPFLVALELLFVWALFASRSNIPPISPRLQVAPGDELGLVARSWKRMNPPRLQMLPVSQYVGVNRDDPIRFYGLPIIGGLYRRRVELCLAELAGGDRILEIGFGSGVTFFNLKERYDEIHGLDLTADVRKVSDFFNEHGVKTVLRNGSVLELPYPDGLFDSVLLISILEHLRPGDLVQAFRECSRVVRSEGQVVYGVPVERPLMVLLFRMLGHDIRKEHFSSERDVSRAARQILMEERILQLKAPLGLFGAVYEVGHFRKSLEHLSMR